MALSRMISPVRAVVCSCIRSDLSIHVRMISSEVKCIDMRDMRKSLLQMISAQKLWIETTDKNNILASLPKSQSDLPVKSMKDSELCGVIPLSVNDKHKLRYLTPHSTVRFGRLLEDLDTFAVACCYKHNGMDGSQSGDFKIPRAIWTVLVDRIDLCSAFRTSTIERDMYLRGHVSWVGNSSMECTITVTQEDNSGMQQKLLEAEFVMVSRNPVNNSSAVVNPLNATTEEEKKILSTCQEHQRLRKTMSDESLLKTVPTEAERSLLHQMFLDTLDPHSSTFKVRVKPDASVWMESTMLKNVNVCFPEQKNLYNKIFGGFLMRQAFELAWTNACIYSKNRCVAVAVDDILFRSPVSIGSFLYLSSQIGYTDANKMQVRVHAEVIDHKTKESTTTNEYHFTLETYDGSCVPSVLPKSYAESMVYLDSRRRFEEAMSFRRRSQDKI